LQALGSSHPLLRGKYLKQQVAEIKESIEARKAEWKKTGCSILTGDWTNSYGVTICNFFVNSPKGTVFLNLLMHLITAKLF